MSKRTTNGTDQVATTDATTDEIRDSSTFYAGFIAGRALVGDTYYLNLARRVAQALRFHETSEP